MLLAYHLVERMRAHPVSQRLGREALRFEQPRTKVGCSPLHCKILSQHKGATKRCRKMRQRAVCVSRCQWSSLWRILGVYLSEIRPFAAEVIQGRTGVGTAMIVGIDIGGSTTDAVVLDNGDVHVVTIEANDPVAAAAGALGKLVQTCGIPLNKVTRVAATGAGSRALDDSLFGLPVVKVNEF